MEPLVMLLLISFVSLSVARDTITPSKPLTDTETLVSAEGTFSLGFFTPTGAKNRYIGIWYNKIPVKTVVWVANRANPVVSSSAILSITTNGTLVITDSESRVVWAAANGSGLFRPVAQVLDTGNFVVREDEIGNYNYAWQGFDYPTDTLLPGMKFGIDPVTGLNRSIRAWTSDNDPFPGHVYAGVEINGDPEVYLWWGMVKEWRSGPWEGIRLSPQVQGFGMSVINNNQEMVFSQVITNESNLSRVTVNHSGAIQYSHWLPGTQQWSILWYAPNSQCDTVGKCGAYGICDVSNSPMLCHCLQGFMPRNQKNWDSRNWADGCVRDTKLDCVNGTDGFVTVTGVKLPVASNAILDTDLSHDECRDMCLKNCSCQAYATADASGKGCLIWVTELLDISKYPKTGPDLYVRVAARDLASLMNHRKNKLRVVAIVVGLLTGTLLLSCMTFFLWRRIKRRREIRNFFRSDSDEESTENDPDLPIFNFNTIAAATESFSAQNKLGEGGFGPVYKGKLRKEKEIAVKRLAKSSQQGTEEFKNEVKLIAKLQNRNLVRLLGCCIQGEERMLIYEYMPNKSLDTFLFVKEKAELLDWGARYKIITGISRGLLCLHHDSRYRIIHRDLKTSNILLDNKMNPKISDFGMARLFGGDKTDHKTRKVVGTYGYMSPEYAMEGIFSLKSDVFSFGVLLLEIISGKKNRGMYAFAPHLNLVAHAWSLWNEGNAMELVDELTTKTSSPDEVLKCIKIGLLCVQEHPEDRPLMSLVIAMLGADITSLPQPKQPGFIGRINGVEFDLPQNLQGSSSTNGLTITLDGR